MPGDFKIDVPHFADLVVDHNKIERLLVKLRPQYHASSFKIKHFTEGITNRLIGCFPEDFDSGKGQEEDVILIRIFGNITELFIDRCKEIANMVLLHQHGLSPPLFCSFSNGIAYGYSPGKVVDRSMVREEFIYNLICLQLVKMHSITAKQSTVTLQAFDPPNTNYNINLDKTKDKKEACLFRLFRRYLALLADSITPGDPVDVFLTNEGLTLENLTKEVDYLEDNLKIIDSPLVFCHNDLLLNNIIYDESQPSISFIDFEYADINYQAFDIANHFNEFSGVDEYNPEAYPSKDFQLSWLACYLKHWDQLTGLDLNGQFDSRVEKLYVQVSKFSLASILFWGIWALLQSLHSKIEYNFFSYGGPRIREYFKKRECLLNPHM